MVPLPAVQSSNSQIASTFPSGLVAVFVGATAGIGEYSLLEFVKDCPKSRIYFVGRSDEAGARVKAECDKLNPEGSCTFIKSDVSLMKNVDLVCREIKSKEKSINLLFLTQGTLDFSTVTSDGLKISIALLFYSRARFMVNLLPEISAAAATPGLARVVTVATGTKEGPLDPDDLERKNVTLRNGRQVGASMVTMGLQVLAEKAPNVSFIHVFPGPVKTSIGRTFTGLLVILKALFAVWMVFFAIPPKETGERHIFVSTSARWPAKEGGAANAVKLANGVAVAKGVDGNEGSGCYSVDEKGESAGPEVVKLLKQYKDDGTREKFWNYTEEKFVELTGSAAI